MTVPLYTNAPSPSRNSNAGLVFDKYFGSWNQAFLTAPLDTNIEKFGDNTKSEWVKSIAERGSKVSPGDAAARLASLAARLGGTSWYAVAISRFVTGIGIDNPLENGFAFHHTLGTPYLAASGLKGAVRNYWRQWHDQKPNDLDDVDPLLGSAKGGAGSVIFFDMLPVEPAALVPEVMTPHYSDWYQKGDAPGDWMSPTPIAFIAVEAGAMFRIAAAPRIFRNPAWPEDERDKVRGLLKSTLDITGLGAKTAVGYGRFLLCDAEQEAQDVSNAIKAALRAERRPPGGQRPVTTFAAGGTLPAGAVLHWDAAGEVFEVRTARAVTLAPGMTIPVTYDGIEDDPHISEIVELKHIR